MTMRDLEGIERKIKTNTRWFEFLTYHNSFIDDSKNTDVILQLARKILLLEDETPEVALEVMALLKV